MLLKKLLLFCILGFLAFSSFAEEAEVQIQKVNINTADAEELDVMLNGVGPKKAAAIVKFREENGPFESAADLMKVKGIGEKTFEQNKAIIIVSSETTESDVQLIECEVEVDSKGTESAEKSSDESDKTGKTSDVQSTEKSEKQVPKKTMCKKPEPVDEITESSESIKPELTEPKSRPGQGTH